MMVLRRVMLTAGIFLLIAGTACETKVTKSQPISNLVPASTPIPEAAQPKSYIIGVGDEVELKFFYTPELNDRLTVRPDGKISIMFAQDIQASGRTTQELGAKIKSVLSSHLKQTDMVVIVRSFGSQKIYVSGEVAKPGPVVMAGRENLLQVMNDAGWITPAATQDQVFLVRRDLKGKDTIYPINLQKILSGEDMSQNVAMQAGDMVLVPPSGITSLDRWVDQSIRQLIPVSTGYLLNNNR